MQEAVAACLRRAGRVFEARLFRTGGPRRLDPPYEDSICMTGILLIQLGTPDAPEAPALKRYLRQFLSDRRVIEVPRLIWWAILNFRILLTRPAESAAKYRRIWNDVTGSPLLHYTKCQARLLQQALPDVARSIRHAGRQSAARHGRERNDR